MAKVSVLLYLNAVSDAEIEQCTESILGNSGLPSEELQVVLLDPFGETDRCDQLKKKYPGVVETADVKGMEEGAAYNVGIGVAQGEYLSFMTSASSIGAGALNNLLEASQGEYTKAGEDGEPVKVENEKNLLTLLPVYGGEDGKGKIIKEFSEKRIFMKRRKSRRRFN